MKQQTEVMVMRQNRSLSKIKPGKMPDGYLLKECIRYCYIKVNNLIFNTRKVPDKFQEYIYELKESSQNTLPYLTTTF